MLFDTDLYLESLRTSLREFYRFSIALLELTTSESHAHSDHYTNLSSNWKGLPIYCSGSYIVSYIRNMVLIVFSETTANLIVHMLSVDRKWVRPLPMNIPVVIPDTGGVQVTLIDANHCTYHA